MKNKFLIFLVCFILVFSLSCFPAYAEDVANGTINSTALTYFEGITRKLSPFEDYVAFRTGDYTYSLVYGNLSYSNGVISSSSATRVDYNSRYYTSNYEYTTYVSDSQISNLRLNTNGFSIIYSSLGSFPKLEGNDTDLLSMLLIGVLFFGFVFFALRFRKNHRSYMSI